MRVNIVDSNGTIVAAFPIPYTRVLDKLDQLDSEQVQCVFGSNDSTGTWSGPASTFLNTADSLILQIEDGNTDVTVNHVSVEMDDGAIRGPAKGITGITFCGCNAVLRKTYDGGCSLKVFSADGSHRVMDLTGLACFRLDNGTARIEYENKTVALKKVVEACRRLFKDNLEMEITIQRDL